ncbi:MAG: hypothetical protein ACJAY9_001222 [Flavobacteriales bacterium]|jgi:hypothetical protein|tara:strand:+ start:2673 stop:2864 length:192 start_codon:yes stop_codon:yes gene_type:complete
MCINRANYRLAYLTLNSSEKAINELFKIINSDISELKEGNNYYFSEERRKVYNKKLKKLNRKR